MATFVLCHGHEPHECRVAFAAWKGFASDLRRKPVLSSCATGDHRLWWIVDAADAAEALGLLPEYVATRTRAVQVGPVMVP